MNENKPKYAKDRLLTEGETKNIWIKSGYPSQDYHPLTGYEEALLKAQATRTFLICLFECEQRLEKVIEHRKEYYWASTFLVVGGKHEKRSLTLPQKC